VVRWCEPGRGTPWIRAWPSDEGWTGRLPARPRRPKRGCTWPSKLCGSSCSKANAGLDIPPHMAARRLSDRRIERDLQVVQRAARMEIRQHQRKMQRPAHVERLGTPGAVNGRCFGRVDRVNGRVPVAYPVSMLSQ